MSLLPPARPQISRAEVAADLAKLAYDRGKYPLIIFGYRGYYLNTMGAPGINDRGLYDDCIGIITAETFAAFNGNTDPTAREGAVEGRACLIPGFWPMWKLDFHKGQYRALCQRLGECTVRRDRTGAWRAGKSHSKWGRSLGGGLWSGWFGINCHRGGKTTTSSEGCQTLPEPMWTQFIKLAEGEARRLWGEQWNKRCIPYALFADV